MNEDFISKLNKSSSYEKIQPFCEGCNSYHNERRVDKIRSVINKHDKYLCAICRNKNKVITQKTRDKLSRGRLGKKHSYETKKLLSQIKKDFYQTEEGKILRKELSIKASKQHVSYEINKYKIKGSCISKKTNKLIAYESSYELRRFWLLDQDDKVIDFCSQRYFEIGDLHRRIDFFIVFSDGTRKIEEVKPKNMLGNPDVQRQIKDIKTICEKLGFDFELITEDFFGMTEKELKKWAIEYRKEIHGIDISGYYEEKNREKVKRHYRNKKCGKISFTCSYCKERHCIREIEYKDNIEKHGRYICWKENGHITGKMPKQKKENKYAAEGKKECVKCCQVLPIDEFGQDKSRRDGLASRCKKCRTEEAKKKYHANREAPIDVAKLEISVVPKKESIPQLKIISNVKHKDYDFVYLSLGAGVQSTALLIMGAQGLFGCPKPDYAIFADTMAEPPWVYEHLEKLKKWVEPYNIPLLVISTANLKEDLLYGSKVSIPAWTIAKDGRETPIHRQCTADYKIRPINQKVKELLGFNQDNNVYKRVGCLLGISTDEIYRRKPSRVSWITNLYPLIDASLDRNDCMDIIAKAGMDVPKRSACFFCPFHNDEHWQNLKDNYPKLFEEAASIENSINQKLTNGAFLNRRLTPLKTIEFSKSTNLVNNFINECEGICGV